MARVFPACGAPSARPPARRRCRPCARGPRGSATMSDDEAVLAQTLSRAPGFGAPPHRPPHLGDRPSATSPDAAMPRTPLMSSLLVLALLAFGLRYAFVPAPQASAVRFLELSPAAAAALAGAAPAVAAEIDAAEAYNRKVLEGAAYGGMLCIFMLGLIVQGVRRDVGNKWLN
ncbi:unnamed protein product [Prorocentrum cordatum]|uniref:PSI-J n=1 Tax=Prorocentrum cordatum TaxID=2364126 RepID=A0ABN9SP32_9DINO|nr:unnamed protein product [Polarella glacialis]